MEVWKEIPQCPGYQISTLGRVKNKKNEIKKSAICRKGYEYTSFGLGSRSEKKVIKIHRLVAEAFIPNPEQKPTVDHINRIKTDNRVENLRWSDPTEQCINRRFPKGVTGQENISLTKYNKFRVVLSRYNEKIFDECFDSLEEAIFMRDSFLDSI